MASGKKRETGVSVRVSVGGGQEIESCLRAELSGEAGVSVGRAKGAVEILIEKRADSWATFRSKVNTALRLVETVGSTVRGILNDENE